MSRGIRPVHVVMLVLAIALLCGGAFAQSEPAKTSAAKPADQAAVGERVTTLEKETVVLREDLGKARLDAKSDLEAAAKRQAEAIARLNKQLEETQAQLEAERAARQRQNRNLWIAVGVVAIGWLASN